MGHIMKIAVKTALGRCKTIAASGRHIDLEYRMGLHGFDVFV
jgi:hypothetical protein